MQWIDEMQRLEAAGLSLGEVHDHVFAGDDSCVRCGLVLEGLPVIIDHQDDLPSCSCGAGSSTPTGMHHDDCALKVAVYGESRPGIDAT